MKRYIHPFVCAAVTGVLFFSIAVGTAQSASGDRPMERTVGSLINDGGFEKGPPPASAWTETSNSACPGSMIVDSSDATLLGGKAPKSGNYSLLLGSFCIPSGAIVGSATQIISFPSDVRYLKFWMYHERVTADDPSGSDVVYVEFNSLKIFTFESIKANVTSGWVEKSIDVTPFAGSTGTLAFGYSDADGGSGGVGSCLIDDVLVEAVSDWTGWYYDSLQPGTGISLEVQGDKLFMAWYVYENDGSCVWYVSLMNKTGPTNYSGDLLQMTGWPLGDAHAPAQSLKKGTGQIDFFSSSFCVFTWNIGGKNDNIPMTRYMEDIAPGYKDKRELNGWWWDPNFPGMGVFVEAQGGKLYAAWYHYRSDGTARWWTIGGQSSSFTESDAGWFGQMQEWSGGTVIGGTYQAPSASNTDTAALTFNSSISAGLQWQGNTYNLEPYDFSKAQF